MPKFSWVLITPPHVGIIANMSAQLLTKFKDITPEGHIIELVVWSVPNPVQTSKHFFKYRAVFIVDGARVVGFDNERGKGDHCHLDGVEMPYAFTTVEQLVEDFIEAVAVRRIK
jgi:hypothetical protein